MPRTTTANTNEEKKNTFLLPTNSQQTQQHAHSKSTFTPLQPESPVPRDAASSTKSTFTLNSPQYFSPFSSSGIIIQVQYTQTTRDKHSTHIHSTHHRFEHLGNPTRSHTVPALTFLGCPPPIIAGGENTRERKKKQDAVCCLRFRLFSPTFRG